ncbi:MAG: hypothetical protein JNM99_05090 [Verrucomicrobiaceae bacterium]|nr:hypothetical protein [Verrucomicrobiaceae bacterium]
MNSQRAIHFITCLLLLIGCEAKDESYLDYNYVNGRLSFDVRALSSSDRRIREKAIDHIHNAFSEKIEAHDFEIQFFDSQPSGIRRSGSLTVHLDPPAYSLYHRSKEDFLIQGTFQGVERCNQFPRQVAEQMHDQMVKFWMIQ